jgi:DNA-binding beta-propeller fold protein YncE
VITEIPVGALPRGVAVNPSTNMIYVARLCPTPSKSLMVPQTA